MKKVLVVTHERSGTYFLIESIARNFKRGRHVERIDLDGKSVNWADPDQFMEFLQRPEWGGIPVLNPFKSHHVRCFFEPIWEHVIREFHVFYVYRDGRDVMVSLWNHLNRQQGEYGPMTYHPRDIISAAPVGMASRYHGSPPPVTMAGRWADHVKSWLQPRWADVCYVKYENLCTDFEGQILRVASHLGMDAPKVAKVPLLGGVHPFKGQPGLWRSYFKQDDVDRFMLHAGDAMRLAGYI